MQCILYIVYDLRKFEFLKTENKHSENEINSKVIILISFNMPEQE